VQRLRIRHRLGGRTHLGLGHDLEQRHAGTVEVDARHAVEVLVQRLARVLFEVRAGQVHRLDVGLALLRLHDEGQRAALHDRDLVLADLVALGEVRVEVVLAREDAARRDGRADREAELDRARDGAAVEHGQGARQREIDHARLRVGFGAKRRRRAREDLARRRELRMRFQPDHHFPLHRAVP
jgi:hypothetical protein